MPSCNRLPPRRLLLLTLALTACAAPAPAPEPTEGAQPPPTDHLARYRELPPASVYRVSASQLTIRVYRAGRLKQFGHNHVLTSSAVSGLAHLAPGGGGFADLHLPVASLVVDDPAARAAAGDAFAATISEANRQGTRDNLLGPRVLDGASFPHLAISLSAPDSAAPPESTAALRVTLKGTTHDFSVPVSWEVADGVLAAQSRFTVTHEQLGLEPFSILGGAIAVADAVEVAITLRATAPTAL